MTEYHTMIWMDDRLRLLDQRRLPAVVAYIDYTDAPGVAEAIRTMVVRGAPAIGAAAAYALALAARNSQARDAASLREALRAPAEILRQARPTAVNLAWAIDRVLKRASDPVLKTPGQISAAVLDEAHAVAEEDIWTNKQMGLNALALVPDKANIFHHCNTGTLATVEYGTALGVIRAAFEHGKQVHVFVDETRPRLQGARLTSWELLQLGIPHTVIVDGASGHVMRKLGADLCVVGCDRVAANGDTANKIGTYNLALVARAHGVPFYVAAPTSTIDLTIPNGEAIKIEERAADEITRIGAEEITPEGARVLNPAFDVTPAEYITAIITEAGVAFPPYESSLKEMVTQARRMHAGRMEARAAT